MINEIVLEYTCLNKTWFKEIWNAITFKARLSDPDIGGLPVSWRSGIFATQNLLQLARCSSIYMIHFIWFIFIESLNTLSKGSWNTMFKIKEMHVKTYLMVFSLIPLFLTLLLVKHFTAKPSYQTLMHASVAFLGFNHVLY